MVIENDYINMHSSWHGCRSTTTSCECSPCLCCSRSSHLPWSILVQTPPSLSRSPSSCPQPGLHSRVRILRRILDSSRTPPIRRPTLKGVRNEPRRQVSCILRSFLTIISDDLLISGLTIRIFLSLSESWPGLQRAMCSCSLNGDELDPWFGCVPLTSVSHRPRRHASCCYESTQGRQLSISELV